MIQKQRGRDTQVAKKSPGFRQDWPGLFYSSAPLKAFALLLLLDPAAAAIHVAEAVLHVLLGLVQVLQAAEHVPLREIPLGFAKILARHAEILRGLIGVVVAVVMMVAMGTLAALAALCTLATEETTQHVSDKRGREACETEHCILLFAKGTRASSMPDARGLGVVVPTNRDRFSDAEHR